jgi:hypothetical protein
LTPTGWVFKLRKEKKRKEKKRKEKKRKEKKRNEKKMRRQCTCTMRTIVKQAAWMDLGIIKEVESADFGIVTLFLFVGVLSSRQLLLTSEEEKEVKIQ